MVAPYASTVTRVGPAGPHRRQILLREGHRFFHLFLGIEEGFVDHGYSH